MASTSTTETYQLQLSSANGPIYRTVLKAPLRDALPSEIPIVDVSGIFGSSLDDRNAVARSVHAAATNNGFFYIKNHGIPSSITHDAYDACLEFFHQDIDVKNRANSSQGIHFNGYKPAASQRINPSESIDVREAFSTTYSEFLITSPSTVEFYGATGSCWVSASCKPCLSTPQAFAKLHYVGLPRIQI